MPLESVGEPYKKINRDIFTLGAFKQGDRVEVRESKRETETETKKECDRQMTVGKFMMDVDSYLYLSLNQIYSL